ncbi:MAG: trypsin-like peptidase domain-containing protein [Oscillospiraceae bacterium]|nr:trypsin-like peptidase domain-containing protein [Oscillospiraceae bacterium]
MNYFDDYYQTPQEEPNYIPQEPDRPEPPKPKKKRKGFHRGISVLLVAALILGSCGATAFFMNLHWKNEMKNLTQQMNDKIAAVQRESGKQNSGAVGRPLADGEYLTPGQVYEQNVDAVVAVTAQIEGSDDYGRPVSGLSSGTGFFISSDGYVVTNYHVIEGGTEVTVTTHNEEEYAAEIIGYEANNDLAVLKVDGENLPCVTVGSSSELLVGDQVVAIGNVLSTFASSLTVGYVSGVDRVVDTQGVAMNMIQTDVAINSGNSGGPLFNMRGEVVGITTAKFSGQSSSGVSIEGIGFAIPMDDVTGMIEDLQKFGYVTGAYLGVMVLDVNASAQYYGIPAGASVESVTAGSAAEKGGIQAKDIITEVGGYPVTSVSDLTRVLRKFAAGDTVSVEVYRGGQTKTLTVTLDEKPREEAAAQPESQLPQQRPSDEEFQNWYDYFRDYFG